MDGSVVGSAIAIGAGAYVTALLVRFYLDKPIGPPFTRWLTLPVAEPAPPPVRRAVLADLETRYADFTGGATGPVDALLTEVKVAHELTRDRIKTIESKAGTLIGIVTTGLGALAILGDPTKVPSHGIWFSFALVAFAAAFVAAMLALAPRSAEYPDLSVYALRKTVQDPANAPRMKYDFTTQLLGTVLTNNRTSLLKGKLVSAATALLGIGLASLTLNYALASPSEKPAPTIHVIQETPVPKQP
jgi:hypothetical protein